LTKNRYIGQLVIIFKAHSVIIMPKSTRMINKTSDSNISLTLEELISKGVWQRRSILDEPQLSEIIELYESLDFEVHLEPLNQRLLDILGEECKSCYIDHWDKYKVIYTRKNIDTD
jgi:hypothetical protein